MLLPSAITHDVKSVLPGNPPYAFSSLKTTAASSTVPNYSNIYTTCHALQLILSPSSTPPIPWQIPSPPIIIRSLPITSISGDCQRDYRQTLCRRTMKHIIKSHTRTRKVDERSQRILIDTKRNMEAAKDTEEKSIPNLDETNDSKVHGSSNFKRIHFSPNKRPFGAESSVFIHHSARKSNKSKKSSFATTSSKEDRSRQALADEDLHFPVEFVLQKLKLSKNDRYECTQNVGRKWESFEGWKSFLIRGEANLKRIKEKT